MARNQQLLDGLAKGELDLVLAWDGGQPWPYQQVMGTLPGQRRFWLCFTAADINAPKTVAIAEAGSEPSLLESFLIDEKKMSLALLVSRLVQRLNGQKWLGPN